MKINKKTIIAAVLCMIGLIWLLPTIFVQKTVLNITDFAKVEEGEIEDVFDITVQYQRGKTTADGQYREAYPKGWSPSVGGQEAGYYYTLPPFSFHTGDAPSPVPPLCCILLGVLVYVGKRPKFLNTKKEDDTNEQP